MRIVITRTGGVAGRKVTWQVDVDEQPDATEWYVLVRRLPWSAAPEPEAAPDRFVYVIRCDPNEVRIGERQLDGPWRQLVDRVRASVAAKTPRAR